MRNTLSGWGGRNSCRSQQVLESIMECLRTCYNSRALCVNVFSLLLLQPFSVTESSTYSGSRPHLSQKTSARTSYSSPIALSKSDTGLFFMSRGATTESSSPQFKSDRLLDRRDWNPHGSLVEIELKTTAPPHKSRYRQCGLCKKSWSI